MLHIFCRCKRFNELLCHKLKAGTRYISNVPKSVLVSLPGNCYEKIAASMICFAETAWPKSKLNFL
jgi:hypothetical protein